MVNASLGNNVGVVQVLNNGSYVPFNMVVEGVTQDGVPFIIEQSGFNKNSSTVRSRHVSVSIACERTRNNAMFVRCGALGGATLLYRRPSLCVKQMGVIPA